MTVLTAEFEKGTNGNTIATSDTGDATPWDTVNIPSGGSAIYDTAHAYGTKSAKLSTTTTGTTYLTWGTAFGTPTDHYGRLYLYMTANPGTTTRLVVLQLSGALAATIRINTTGKVELCDQSGVVKATSTNAISLNHWIRLEWHIKHSATVGQIEVKLYNQFDVDGVASTETITTVATINTLANADAINFGNRGINIVNLGPYWLDNIVAGVTAAYPGPFPNCTVDPDISGGTPFGSTLICDGGTWVNGFTLAYQWTRDGVAISGATSSTYVTQIADVGHSINCTVTATGHYATYETASKPSFTTIIPTSARYQPGFVFAFG